MARRIPTIEVPLTADIPPGNVTASEWTEVKSDLVVAYEEAQLSQTRTYDTRAFPTIQDAIDTAHTNGGGTVFLADSELTPQTLTLRDGVYLTGRGIGATTLKVHSIFGSGSVSQLPSLASSVSRNARTVTFSGSHGLAPGDVFIIYNPTDSSFYSGRPVYRDGEFCKVAIVEGNTVTLTAPLYAGHTASGVQVYKLNPIRTGVSGMTIECTEGQTGLKVEYGTDLVFRDLVMYGSSISLLTVSRCYGVNINDFKGWDYGPLGNTNYGITVSNSQRVRVNHVEIETRRHGFMTGGDNTLCSVPNRDIIVADSFINGLSELGGVCGCNLHGNAEYVQFDNCRFPSGVNPGGDYVTIRNCDISTAPWGTAIDAPEMVGYNLTIENNTIRATDPVHSTRGLVYLPFTSNIDRPNGITRIKNNLFDFELRRSGGGNHQAIYTVMQGSNTAGNKVLEVMDNTFRALSTATTYSWSVRVNTDGATWTDIYFSGNRYSGVHFTFERNAGTQLPWFEDEGNFTPTFPAQRGSVFRRRGSGGPAPVLYVKQDSTSSGWKAVDSI